MIALTQVLAQYSDVGVVAVKSAIKRFNDRQEKRRAPGSLEITLTQVICRVKDDDEEPSRIINKRAARKQTAAINSALRRRSSGVFISTTEQVNGFAPFEFAVSISFDVARAKKNRRSMHILGIEHNAKKRASSKFGIKSRNLASFSNLEF